MATAISSAAVLIHTHFVSVVAAIRERVRSTVIFGRMQFWSDFARVGSAHALKMAY